MPQHPPLHNFESLVTEHRVAFGALVRATAASWGLQVAGFDHAGVSVSDEFLDAVRASPGEGLWTELHA